jgi:hypothetical protein
MRKKAPVLRRPLMTQRQAAEYTGFSARRFRRWIDEDKLEIPVKKVRGRNYYDPDDLDRLVAGFRGEVPADREGRW